jgi:hypothetical protein
VSACTIAARRDCEIHHIAPHDERLEIIPHGSSGSAVGHSR